MEGVTFRELDGDGNPIEPQQVEETTVDETTEIVDEQLETVDEQVDEPQEEEKIIEPVGETTEDTVLELDENSILSYFKNKLGREYASIEDVLRQPEETTVPEDVAKYLEYKKETGRSFNDFLNLQKDWNEVGDTDVLKEYYKESKPHLDDSEINYLLEDNFSYDEELDDEREVKKKQIAIKEELYKARNHFEGLKEKFKAPLESSAASLPEDYQEAYSFYNDYKQKSATEEEVLEQRSKVFAEKTNALFNEEFKGFEFNLGDKKAVFEVKDASTVKQTQSDISNFFSRHLDDNGFIKDPKSYHKEMYAATNADQIARHFYEQGLADATKDLVKETKNIDMDVRSNASVDSKGPKFRIVDSGSDFTMKIKKR